MLLIVSVPEPVLCYVPVVPAPVIVHVPPITFVHGVPPVSPDDGGLVVFVVEPGVVDEIWFSTRLKPKCAPSTLVSACVTTELSGPASSVGAAAAGKLKFASSPSASNAAKIARDGLPRVIKSPPFPSGLVWWPVPSRLSWRRAPRARYFAAGNRTAVRRRI